MRLAIALFLAATAVFAADQTAAQKEVAAATEQFRTAMISGDAAALGRILHADLTYEHSSALTQNKAEAIAAVVKPGGAPKAIDFHDATTRIYGNTALFKARADYTNGKGDVSHLDVLMVWIKTPAGWQLVGRQSTKVQ